jgi:PAS domain-containing protein
MRRFQLLDVVPVACHFLVESMTDGVLVLDAQDRVVDVNPVARALMGDGAEVIGLRADEVPGPLGAAIAVLRERAVNHLEIQLPGDPGLFVDMHLSPLLDRDGSTSGRVVVVRDTSDRRALELEREKLIKDDKGSWSGLERYITDHSDAQFSHGICPDCMRKLYPDLAG